MRQRALSTWLTLFSVMLGVSLAIAILLIYREGDKLFSQADFGFDVVVGAKTGGSLDLVLNSVYQIGQTPTPLNYSVYEKLAANPDVRWAIPWAVGDNYHGHRLIGTSTATLGVDENLQALPARRTFEYRVGRALKLAKGRPFYPRRFEAVIGAQVAQRTDLRMGSKFKASHGAERDSGAADKHAEEWEVVGVLEPTHTAIDRVILIPLASALAVPSHAEVMEKISDVRHVGETREATSTTATATTTTAHGEDEHEHYYHMENGEIQLELPKDKWIVSAVLLRTTGAGRSQDIIFQVDNQPYATAVNPAREMRQFFEGFLSGSRYLLLAISALVTVVAAVGILVSIYNSVTARLREIAILRALGATRMRVVTLICFEAGLIGLIGGIAGLIGGHLLGAAGNVFFERFVGESINYLSVGDEEIIYVGIVVVIALIAGLVPALKVYKTPVATNLMA